MTRHKCSRLTKPCVDIRIDPCDCRYYYECTPQGIIHRYCANAVIFDENSRTCVFPSNKICDTNKPWNRCRLEDFAISSDQIQSVATCREYWPVNMSDWRKGSKGHTNSTTTPTAPSKTATTKWSIPTNHRPVSNVTVDRRLTPLPDQFDNTAAKTYIPVIVCAMIALIAFVAIVILWKKRSDVKAFVAGLCCVGGKEMSKAICNPGYENTIVSRDPRLDQTAAESVYHEIPCLRHSTVVKRPLPETPPQQQQQTARASTFAGFGCPDVAVRKEQQLIQRTNSACQTFDKLTGSDDRNLIDAQERFENEYEVSSERNVAAGPRAAGPRATVPRAAASDRKTQTSEELATEDKTRPERNRSHNANAVDRRGSATTVNGVERHRTSSGILRGIEEDLELSTSTINPTENTSVSDSESIPPSENSQCPLSRDENNSGPYSEIWKGD